VFLSDINLVPYGTCCKSGYIVRLVWQGKSIGYIIIRERRKITGFKKKGDV